MKYLCKIFVNWNEIKIVNMKLKGGGFILININLFCWFWLSILFFKYLIYYLYFLKIFGIVFII